MRKPGILTLFLVLSLVSFSQSDSTAYQKLQKQFNNLYQTSRASTESNYYRQLTDAAMYTVRINHPLFFPSIRELNKVYPGKDMEWSVQKLTDTLLNGAVKEQLWRGMEAGLAKSKPTLELYNARVCECISAQIKKEEDYRNLLAVSQECNSAIGQDALFANRLAVSMASLTVEEKMQLPRYASRYSYQNCPTLYVAMNDALMKEMLGHYYNDLDALTAQLHEKVAALWNQQKKDSLQALFPGYKRSEDDLKKLATVVAKTQSALYDKKEQAGRTTVTRTFVSDYNKPQLLGQVIYSYSVKETTVTMHSLRFIVAEKIPNKEALLKDLEEMPPPPIEVLPAGKN